ncbi:nucleoside phosphorylase [Streptomyces sp. NRRL F-5053]|uniref:nucleoside phosphorylase n=1 Tax=Streptomyces sp. NRRL F-5053 TaxID=1463854 RepID=UPI000A9562A4|nr:nucleoside phosphorylase [Streptomyces sp. NRRL F-5053]
MPDPSEHAAWIRSLHGEQADLTRLDGVVLLYQNRLLEHARHHYQPRVEGSWVRGKLLLLRSGPAKLGICGSFGIGAPAAGLVLEQLIALGVTRVVTIGTAAALQPRLAAGDAVVCESALRDEGLSHHYLPPGIRAAASPELARQLSESLRARCIPFHRGESWTTDAPFRETAEEIRHHSSRGVLTADMEAAGVFAVAAHRGIQAAAAFATADSLIHRRPRRLQPHVPARLRALLDAALHALSTAADPPLHSHTEH